MNKGAALIISVLILATIMVGFAVIGSRPHLNETNNLTALINKKTADSLATACVEDAFYKLGNNASYAGNETVNITAGTCTTRPVIASGGTWTIETQATAGASTSRLRVVLSARSPIVISSWQSLVAF